MYEKDLLLNLPCYPDTCKYPKPAATVCKKNSFTQWLVAYTSRKIIGIG